MDIYIDRIYYRNIKSTMVSFVSFNIDTNIARLENGYAKSIFPEWRVSERMPIILHYLLQNDPDIVQIQEARKCELDSGELIDSITPIVNKLSDLDYEVIVFPYNPNGGKTFNYITAFKKDKYNCIKHYPVYYTESPHEILDRTTLNEDEIKAHNFGAFWERCCLICVLSHNGEIINCVNTHIDINWNVRMKSSRLLSELLDDLDGRVICSGDFNSFPDWNGKEQMELFHLHDAMAERSTSFISFPYDFGKNHIRLAKTGIYETINDMENEKKKDFILKTFEQECDALGGCLDHVLHKGFSEASCNLILTSDDIMPLEETTIKKYVLEKARQNKPAFASDHQLIYAEFKL